MAQGDLVNDERTRGISEGFRRGVPKKKDKESLFAKIADFYKEGLSSLADSFSQLGRGANDWSEEKLEALKRAAETALRNEDLGEEIAGGLEKLSRMSTREMESLPQDFLDETYQGLDEYVDRREEGRREKARGEIEAAGTPATALTQQPGEEPKQRQTEQVKGEAPIQAPSALNKDSGDTENEVLFEFDRQTENQQDPIIKAAQEQLRESEGMDIDIDGYLGPQTSSALKQFQADNGLEPTGDIDRKTLAALGVETND